MIGAVLAPADARRAAATLDRLIRAGLRDPAVTGGVAIAWHLAQASGRHLVRALNDLDLVVADVGAIPAGLDGAFLISHAHPDAPPGRMLVQAVDPATRLRVDVFGAFGGQWERSRRVPSLGGEVRVVAAGDLAARLAALLLDLGLGEPVPAKHAREFLALAEGVGPTNMQSAWEDHRRPRHPASCAEARRLATDLIRERDDLLVARPRFDVDAPCSRCRDVAGLRLASPEAVAAALGPR